MTAPGIPTLSLFSGAGGLDLGFLQAGFDIKACVEIEPSYCTTLSSNCHGGPGYLKQTIIHCEDIRHFDARQYRGKGIRCIIGGPPCQTFSAAGRRAGGVIGTEDERGQLFHSYCKILDIIQPEVFVFENVYGLPGANGGKPWREIVAAFSKRGFQLRAEVVDAADYGVPQHRERLILVGFRQGNFEFPMPTHGPDGRGETPLVSVEEAISDLQDPDESYHNVLGGLYGHLLPLVPEGLNYAYFTAEMGHPSPVFAWRSKFHDLLYKVKRTEPCRTLKAQPGKFTGPFHWKNRHFTVPELKRLQSFPDDYKLVGSFAKVLEQIGNSVPPRLAFVMASSVRDQLLAPKKTHEFPVRPPGFRSTFRQRQRLKSEKFSEIAASAFPKQHNRSLNETTAPKSETYYLTAKSLFEKSRHARKPAKQTSPLFRVQVSESGTAINISVEAITQKKLRESKINITGLRKYLPDYESLSVVAFIENFSDIFHVWAVIEEALVKRSRFFTLIDIYGHYANRGDTVDVCSNWRLPKQRNILAALNYFGSTKNCGDFINEETLLNELNISRSALLMIVRRMREVRFDIRTSLTHPIIGEKRLICTYPFPLLSPRALVESRARFVAAIKDDDLLKIAS